MMMKLLMKMMIKHNIGNYCRIVSNNDSIDNENDYDIILNE